MWTVNNNTESKNKQQEFLLSTDNCFLSVSNESKGQSSYCSSFSNSSRSNLSTISSLSSDVPMEISNSRIYVNVPEPAILQAEPIYHNIEVTDYPKSKKLLTPFLDSDLSSSTSNLNSSTSTTLSQFRNQQQQQQQQFNRRTSIAPTMKSLPNSALNGYKASSLRNINIESNRTNNKDINSNQDKFSHKYLSTYV
jgi:hypothetical protein